MIPEDVARDDVLAAFKDSKSGDVEAGFGLSGTVRYSNLWKNSDASASRSRPFSEFAGAFVLSVTPPNSPLETLEPSS